MQEKKLPENYAGYSTGELLGLWTAIKDNTAKDNPAYTGEMVGAMHDLLKDYRLAGVHWRDQEERRADIVEAKKFLAPYGIYPAPWLDAEGNKVAEEDRARWIESLRRNQPRSK